MKHPFPKVTTQIPGPKSLELFEREQKHISTGLQRMALVARIAVKEGHGALLTDADGNVLVDLVAGVAVTSLGHGHPKYAKAISDQVARISAGSWTNEPRVRFLERLAPLLPKEIDRVQLYSGGAEAVEAAIRLAKSVTGRFEVLGFWGGFHGKTTGVLGLIGDEFKQGWGPLAVGTHLAPYADCYRCPIGQAYPSCGMACVEFLRKQIKASTLGSLAAILVEPMQGTAGNVIPPPEFLPAVKEVAKENGALLIADEMITGFGRTGKMWGMDHTGTTPDIMTMGKGIASGFPVSALAAKEPYTRAKPYAKPSAASSSYGGNPLACAAADAALSVIQEEKLIENSRTVGAYMLERLQGWKERLPIVGEVRGAGLFLGMDLVKDRTTKQPLSGKTCERIYLECLKRGVLVMIYSPRVRIHPPLVITREQAEAGLDVIEEVLGTVGTGISIE
ncbi:MAG: aspartate aminotransferase family protein [Planctomycetota bacterium]